MGEPCSELLAREGVPQGKGLPFAPTKAGEGWELHRPQGLAAFPHYICSPYCFDYPLLQAARLLPGDWELSAGASGKLESYLGKTWDALGGFKAQSSLAVGSQGMGLVHFVLICVVWG